MKTSWKIAKGVERRGGGEINGKGREKAERDGGG